MRSIHRPAAAMLVMAAAVAFVAACTTKVTGTPSTPLSFGGKVFDEHAVEDGVRRIVEQYQPGVEIRTVECPAHQPVVAGTAFECKISMGGATPRDTTVTVTVKDDNGTYEVGQPE